MFKFLREFLFGSKREVAPTFQKAMAKREVIAREFAIKSTYVKPESRPIKDSNLKYAPTQSDFSQKDDMVSNIIDAALLFEALSVPSSISDSSTDSSNNGFEGGFGGGDYSGGGSGGSWEDSSSSSNDSYSSSDSSDSSSSSSDY